MGLLAKLTGNKPAPMPMGRSTTPTARYRGVQVITDPESCCRAAREFSGQRFLSSQIPRFPLEACDSTDCRCTYRLYDDRRTGTRRLSDFCFDIVSDLRTDDDRRWSADDRRKRSSHG